MVLARLIASLFTIVAKMWKQLKYPDEWIKEL
jgi:hypothetical protein